MNTGELFNTKNSRGIWITFFARVLLSLITFVFLTLLIGCNTNNETEFVPTLTNTPFSTLTPTVAPTQTLKPTNTPTPTSIPQVFQPIFPEEFTGAGVAANHPGEGLHFDVGIPMGFVAEQDAIISPASGNIIEHYFPGNGDEGECITILPEPPLQGIDELVRSLGYDPTDVSFVYFHLSHIIPYKTSGWIDVGEEVGVVHDRMTRLGQWSNIVAFVVRIGLKNREIQVSPCEIPNNFDWCDICYPGAAERNPCP